MKKGSRRCKICGKFTPEPIPIMVRWIKIYLCHPCYVHLLSSLHLKR